MRPITRNLVVGLLVVLGLLLALGAVPSLLQSGDPFYMEATVAEAPDGVTPVNGSELSERRYPYTFGAVDATGDGAGRSDAYYRGPFGFKGAFTHSPFDETAAYAEQYPDAVTDSGTYVRLENTTYRVAVVEVEE
ncbi:hypothetical protein [Halosegnis marinus]|uniref:Uncharacterized protein n=1 Tax=Halosegnis marinus TaxID=3034023 RepID=A0ABD5ZM10_9EURY|nr:hypothetical protein [Halosegnis sp. DT85]